MQNNIVACVSRPRRPSAHAMKFLSIDQLDALTSFLSDREAGDRILNGRIEAFSWCAFVIERGCCYEPSPLYLYFFRGLVGLPATPQEDPLSSLRRHLYNTAAPPMTWWTHTPPSKRAGEDKKLSKLLEQQYADEAASSPSLMGSSPLGPLSESGTRRLLIDLISTMNASFPDHDFSSLRPDQFIRETNINQVGRLWAV